MRKFPVILIVVLVILFTLWWIKVGEFERVAISNGIDNSIAVEKNHVTMNQSSSNDRDSMVGPIASPLDLRSAQGLFSKNQLESNGAKITRELSNVEIRKIAEHRLDSFNIDYSDRIPGVTYNGNNAICTFPVPLPPSGDIASVRGGDFIVIIDLASGEVMDVKIWR